MRSGLFDILWPMPAMVAMAIVLVTGCAGNQTTRNRLPVIENASDDAPEKRDASSERPKDDSQQVDTESPATETAANTKDADVGPAASVEDNLAAIGRMDAAEKDRLLAERDDVPAHLWPSFVRQRRGELEYRQRQQQRDSEIEAASHEAAATSSNVASADTSVYKRNQEASASRDKSPSDTSATQSPQGSGHRQAADAASSGGEATRHATATSPTAPNATSASPNSSPASNSAAVANAAGAEASPPGEASIPHAENMVRLAAHDAELTNESAQWSGHLASAIRDLEQATGDTPQSAAEVELHAKLRLLYLAASRQEEAMRPIPGVSPTQQDYWSSQVFGLSTYLDDRKIPDARQRAATAKEHLAEAMQKLGALATLSVRNLAFCQEVKSFGVYEQFEPARFRPGQEVLIYGEVDNFRSDSTEKGYHTSLRSSYLILDSQGQRVDTHEFPIVNDYCRNPRRDFFVRHFVTLPERIYDGTYTLQLIVEDTQSNEIGQASIEFEIDEQPDGEKAHVVTAATGP